MSKMPGTVTAGRIGRTAVAVAALVGATGCTDWAGYDLDSFWGYIPALGTMRTSVTYDPHEMPRLPAEGAIPVESPNGDAPPRFTQIQLDSVAGTLTNPFAGQTSGAVLERGAVMYQRQCTVCHGAQGEGTGPAVGPGKYPFAPAINIPATAARSDGYLYGVITTGRGLMPPYGHAISHEDRWAIVQYVRQLQSQAGAGAAPGGAAAPATAAPAPAAPGTTPPETASDSAPDGAQP